MGFKYFFSYKILIIMISINFVHDFVYGAESGYKKNDLKKLYLAEKNKLEESIIEYDSKISGLNQDILESKFKEEYINNHIKRISDQNRKASYTLYNSQKIILKKMEAFSREKERLSSLILKHSNRLLDLDKEVKKEFSDEYLEWWSFSDRISKFIAHKGKKQISEENFGPENLNHKSIHNLSELKEELEEKIDNQGQKDWIKIINEGTASVLKVQSPILFGSGSANIVDKYKSFLKKLGRILSPYPIKIRVEGFTDSHKIKKKFPSNWDLGARRAINVSSELMKSGVAPSAFTITSHGEYGPYYNEKHQSDLIRRRSEITITF